MNTWFPCVVGVGKQVVIAVPPDRRGTSRCIANYSRISSCMPMLIASSALHLISGGQAICLFFDFFLFRDKLKLGLGGSSLIWLCKQFWVWSSPRLDRLEGPGCVNGKDWMRQENLSSISNQSLWKDSIWLWNNLNIKQDDSPAARSPREGGAKGGPTSLLQRHWSLIRLWWRKTKYENAGNECVEYVFDH